MTDAERQSRENFYKNIAWIIDGSEFKNNFDIYHRLPNPHSEIAQDIVWVKAKRNLNGANYGLFFRLSEARAENPGIVKSKVRSGTIYDIRELQASLDESYNGYHQFDWVRPRKTWLDSRHPVYIDFGGENLVRLCMYDESELSCIQYVSKKKFLHDALNESRAVDIATRFYPLPL
jgi:hypothetical protein